MEKLQELINKCKCGIHITINDHRDNYETVEQYFESNPINKEYLEDIEPDIYEKMKELNTIVDLHFYPNTTIGFYTVHHYDIEKAIDEALIILNKNL